jgi:hypothetical protein
MSPGILFLSYFSRVTVWQDLGKALNAGLDSQQNSSAAR